VCVGGGILGEFIIVPHKFYDTEFLD
jgi:hypothetical protein